MYHVDKVQLPNYPGSGYHTLGLSAVSNLGMRLQVVKIFTVTGDSMSPSFRQGDLLLVGGFTSYRRKTAMRKDVVVLRAPSTPHTLYLKRVIGMPQEEIEIFEGALYINGEHLIEPYLCGLPSALGMGITMCNLGEDSYYVLGDRRSHSTDSRDFGPVDANLIVGRAWFRIWPLKRLGFI